MPGIAGIVSTDGLASHQQEIQRAVQVMAEPLDGMQDGLAADWIAVERGALASVSLPALPAPVACRELAQGRKRVWLALHGTVFLEPQPPGEARAAEILLDRYLAGGLDAVCGLNGTYALAIFEEESGRLTLVKDRCGYGRLFYWHDGSRLVFASEIKAIYRHPGFRRRLDLTAAADLFLYRAPIEDRTLFDGIRGLPPAGVLTFQDGVLQVRSYWALAFPSPGAPERRDEEYTAEMAERMRAAVRRRVLPGSCLLITGGLDSRIVGGIYQQVAPHSGLSAATLGLPGGGDVQLGGELARALGIPHRHILIDTTYLARWAAACTWKAEARNGTYASWIMAAAPFLQQNGYRYVLTGLYGNFISGTYFPPGLLKARTLEDGLRVMEGSLNPYLGQLRAILRPGAFEAAVSESAGAVARIYRAAGSDSVFQRSDAVNFYLRVSRQATTEDSLGHAALPLEPYLDNDVFDYAIGAIPPGVRARGMYSPLLVLQHLPAAARVPMNHTGRRLEEDIAIRRSPLRSFVEDTRARLRRGLERRLLHRLPSKATPPSIPHVEAIRAGSRDFVAGLFAQAEYYDDLIDPRAASAVLENHISGRSAQYMTIDSLVTLILWRQQFQA